MLANVVFISDGTMGSSKVNAFKNPNGEYSLIFGNYDKAGGAKTTYTNEPAATGTAMDPTVPLLFGKIEVIQRPSTLPAVSKPSVTHGSSPELTIGYLKANSSLAYSGV